MNGARAVTADIVLNLNEPAFEKNTPAILNILNMYGLAEVESCV